jgi:hypothetical protein
MAWSKVKSILRKLKARTFDELTRAMKVVLDSISASDLLGWFRHDGYIANV